MILGSIFIENVMLFALKALPLPNALARKGVFHNRKHQIFEENRSPNHMKIMSKIFQFFISCCKCIFWCWWARGVYGNVSRVLQTRKTTNFCTVFHIIHYNRDLNTNWTPAAPRYSGFVMTLPSRSTENDLLQRLFTFRRCPWKPRTPPTCPNFS